MAIVTISFDTTEKKMKCSIDEREIPGVIEANLYKSYGDKKESFRCSVVTMAEDETNDIRTFTQIMAAKSDDVEQATASKQEIYTTDVDDFLAVVRVEKRTGNVAVTAQNSAPAPTPAPVEQASAGLGDVGDLAKDVEAYFFGDK